MRVRARKNHPVNLNNKKIKKLLRLVFTLLVKLDCGTYYPIGLKVKIVTSSLVSFTQTLVSRLDI